MNEILFKVLCHNIHPLTHVAYEQGLNIEAVFRSWIRRSGDPPKRTANEALTDLALADRIK